MKKGLIEIVDHRLNERNRKVRVYGRVPPDRVGQVRAVAKDQFRVKPPRERPLETRKRMVRELFKDQDLLDALAADAAAERATARARKAARDELRTRERQAAELRRHERLARSEQDPRLPFWRALREFSHGSDAARVLKMMLDRDVQLVHARGEMLLDPSHWADSIRHTTDVLQTSSALHVALLEAFGVPRSTCPACGADAPVDEEPWEVVEGEVLDDLAELVSSDE